METKAISRNRVTEKGQWLWASVILGVRAIPNEIKNGTLIYIRFAR